MVTNNMGLVKEKIEANMNQADENSPGNSPTDLPIQQAGSIQQAGNVQQADRIVINADVITLGPPEDSGGKIMVLTEVDNPIPITEGTGGGEKLFL